MEQYQVLALIHVLMLIVGLALIVQQVITILLFQSSHYKYCEWSGHLQTKVCMLNIIVTLLLDPPPTPLLNIIHATTLLLFLHVYDDFTVSDM